MTMPWAQPQAPHNNHVRTPWTDERKKKVRALFEEKGLSCGQIAKALGGGITRNAIISLKNRMGLKRSTVYDKRQELRPRHRAKGATTQPTQVCPQVIHKAHFTKKRRLRLSLADVPDGIPGEPLCIQPSEYDQAIPQEQRRTLLQLNSLTCRWPCGDPQKPDFFFCGAITTHTYCRHHAARAYRA
jgi:GcrA cell cycle regulator